MATSTGTMPRPQAASQEIDLSKLLNDMLDRAPSNERYRVIDDALQKRIEKVEELLPDQMRGQAPRLVKRAMLTFSRSAQLQKCTPESFIRCVLQAAELGLAIDGRMAHAVPFKNRIKEGGKDRWADEAQFIPDYKGIIAVARRIKVIRDAYADVICRNDVFEAWRDGDCDHLKHARGDLSRTRGEVIGAYAVIKLPDGEWRYELMNLEELHHVRAKSKSWARKDGATGPWVTDPNEMFKKTVLKRGLKTYADDPAIIRIMELDDSDYEEEEPRRAESRSTPPTGRTTYHLPESNGNGHTPAPSQPEEPQEDTEAADASAVEREPGDDAEPSGMTEAEKAEEAAIDALVEQIRQQIDAANTDAEMKEAATAFTRNARRIGEQRHAELSAAWKEKNDSMRAPVKPTTSPTPRKQLRAADVS